MKVNYNNPVDFSRNNPKSKTNISILCGKNCLDQTTHIQRVCHTENLCFSLRINRFSDFYTNSRYKRKSRETAVLWRSDYIFMNF